MTDPLSHFPLWPSVIHAKCVLLHRCATAAAAQLSNEVSRTLNKNTCSCLSVDEPGFSFSPVWPDWSIYWILGNFLKPLATTILPKSPTFLDNICKLVKIYHFLDKSFLGNFYRHLVIFYGHTGSLTHSSPSIKYCCNLVSAALTFLLQAVWPDLAKFDHFGKTLKDRQ